jgi:hypothetical protein
VVWCGVVWCGVVWCGVVWCGVVWCGVVWCGRLSLAKRWSIWCACQPGRGGVGGDVVLCYVITAMSSYVIIRSFQSRQHFACHGQSLEGSCGSYIPFRSACSHKRSRSGKSPAGPVVADGKIKPSDRLPGPPNPPKMRTKKCVLSCCR